MNLITFIEPITVAFRKSAGGTTVAFEAGREYLIANSQIDRLIRDENVMRKLYKLSKVEMRVSNFNAAAPKKVGTNRLLIFNASGGYGDQIMTWPLAHILTKRGYDVHVLTDPGNNVCWWNFPWIKSVLTIPLLWEQVKMFDHLLFMEHVVNMDEHQDQEHPLDMMLAHIGIDPRDIPKEDKIVKPIFTFTEVQGLQAFLNSGKKIGLYQLASANPIRSLPPSDSAFMAMKLAEAFPDMHWLCLYDEFIPKPYVEMLSCKTCAGKGIVPAEEGKSIPCTACGGSKYLAPNIEPFCAPSLRDLWALTAGVSVVVAPDSMMVHVAGVQETPCVGLWGPVPPDKRVRYYKNHIGLFPQQACAMAPCFAYSAVFPKYCPPRPSRAICDVIASIAPAQVVEMVKKIRR